MHVRRRHERDLPALVAVLARTHREAGYPVLSMNVGADWLVQAHELGAWVVEESGRPVGQVALHPAGGPSAPVWRVATGRADTGLAVVSRLLSDAHGAGSVLLAHAEQEAAQCGRVRVLEVDLNSPARNFYLRRGWTQVGQVAQRWGTLDVQVGVLVCDPSRPAHLWCL